LSQGFHVKWHHHSSEGHARTNDTKTVFRQFNPAEILTLQSNEGASNSIDKNRSYNQCGNPFGLNHPTSSG